MNIDDFGIFFNISKFIIFQKKTQNFTFQNFKMPIFFQNQNFQNSKFVSDHTRCCHPNKMFHTLSLRYETSETSTPSTVSPQDETSETSTPSTVSPQDETSETSTPSTVSI